MNFRVGQKVVCVDATPCGFPSCNLMEGAVYTVTGLHKGGIKVAEAKPRYACDGFLYWRFRPAVEPDISIFTAMLTKTPRENRRAARKPLRERADA